MVIVSQLGEAVALPRLCAEKRKPIGVPNFIRAWRRRSGLTLARLAVQVGREVNAVSRWERSVQPITLDQLARVADVLDCTIIDLLTRDPEVDSVDSECHSTDESRLARNSRNYAAGLKLESAALNASTYTGIRFDARQGWLISLKKQTRGPFKSEAQAVEARRLLLQNLELRTPELKQLTKDVDLGGHPVVATLAEMQKAHGRKPYDPKFSVHAPAKEMRQRMPGTSPGMTTHFFHPIVRI